MIADQREKKNNRIAWATSIGVHAALFLIFLFAVAWRAPDPPLPEYGIQLNFGLDTQGSGDVQPESPVGTEQQAEQTEEVKSKEQQEETPSETKPAESNPVEQPVTTKQESPVTVKEEKKEEKPKEKVETKTEVKETPKKEEKALYKPGEKTETKTGQTGNQGDDAGKTGDKGDPKGSLDSKALYGKQGGGDGDVGLSMAGWDWLDKPNPPKPTENDQFGGKVVFEIKVDSDGGIIAIKKIEGTLSFELERRCKEEIQKSSLQKNSSGKAAEITTGFVTFYLSIK